jgi:hypothetical protein
MVSLPLHGKIYAVNGDNIVAFNIIFVIIGIHMAVIYMCMGFTYLCIARNWYAFIFDASLMAC